MDEIKIRYNTEKDKTDASLPAWRVLINGIEHLATEVELKVVSKTTEDILPSGILKWHISCVGKAEWNGLHCTITSANTSTTSNTIS